MRHAIAALLGLSLTACFSASDAVAPPESVPPPDEPRVLGGVAVCDSCTELSIDVTGPGLLNVTSAAVLSRAPGHAPIRADIDARRFTGDYGTVLRVHVRFTDIVAPGAYDLRLDTPGANAPAQAVALWSALLEAGGDAAPGEAAHGTLGHAPGDRLDDRARGGLNVLLGGR